ncbi:MAG: 50S ribosomal protein L32e [Thermoplasmata archaeon]|nr:50S ribosomal protein L32e [Thermoplasmata archaeon]
MKKIPKKSDKPKKSEDKASKSKPSPPKKESSKPKQELKKTKLKKGVKKSAKPSKKSSKSKRPKKDKAKSKPAKVEDEEEVEIVEGEGEEEEEELEEEHVAKQKPVLDKAIKLQLSMRRRQKRRKPKFRRQEWFRYKRLGTSWRKPKGLHSKMRTNRKYRPNVVRIGYGSPKIVRGLHPSGFKEILVYNVNDLKDIDPKTEAARIGHSVGTKKRIELEKKADKLGIRVLNKGA